jgi:predicted  nucleic acid-binding Zn-ribbon protein
MSDAAERRRREVALWDRLERSAHEATAAIGFWKRRAREAEEEVIRLRLALEEHASGRVEPGEDLRDEVRRLRAQNAALESRMLQARKRVAALMKRLAALGVDA